MLVINSLLKLVFATAWVVSILVLFNLQNQLNKFKQKRVYGESEKVRAMSDLCTNNLYLVVYW